MTFQAHEITNVLRTLHRMHRQLSDLKGQLDRGPKVIQVHQAQVAKRESEVEAIRQEVLNLRVATDEKQLQLASNEASVQKRRGQLLQANDNKEYQALNDEISAAVMSNSVLEDEILEALERAEEIEERISRANDTMATSQKELEDAQQRFAEKEPLLEADINRLLAEIDVTAKELPGDIRELYKRSTRARGEEALAEIRGVYCSGCNQQVPVNMINLLMLGTPAICKSCGRLLYLSENMESVDPEST